MVNGNQDFPLGHSTFESLREEVIGQVGAKNVISTLIKELITQKSIRKTQKGSGQRS